MASPLDEAVERLSLTFGRAIEVSGPYYAIQDEDAPHWFATFQSGLCFIINEEGGVRETRPNHSTRLEDWEPEEMWG